MRTVTDARTFTRLVTACMCLGSLAGCGGGGPKPIKQICATSEKCLQFNKVSDPDKACDMDPKDPLKLRSRWQVRNAHPDKEVFAAIHRVGQSAGIPDQHDSPLSYQLRAGTSQLLGCRWNNALDTYYSYLVDTSCFSGECPGTPATPLPLTTGLMCAKECAAGLGKHCVGITSADAYSGAAKAMMDLSQTLRTSQLPTTADLAALLTAASGVCSFNPAVITATTFSTSGESCNFAVELKHKELQELHVYLPTVLSGDFSRIGVGSPGASAKLKFVSPASTPKLEWYGPNMKLVGVEDLASIDVFEDRAIFQGARNYCMAVTWKPGL